MKLGWFGGTLIFRNLHVAICRARYATRWFEALTSPMMITGWSWPSQSSKNWLPLNCYLYLYLYLYTKRDLYLYPYTYIIIYVYVSQFSWRIRIITHPMSCLTAGTKVAACSRLHHLWEVLMVASPLNSSARRMRTSARAGPRAQGTKGPQMVFTIHRWFSHKQWVEFDRPCITDGKVFDFFEDLKALQVAALF